MKDQIKTALTFDDVLLVPQESSVLPDQVELVTELTKNITLNIPIISAAMDTVTSSEMSIALAREGGMGVIHKNFSIDKQAEQVDRVKRSESGMIIDPITIESNKKIKDALDIMSHFRISGIPVVDDGKLVGILTNRDIRFETDHDILISDRMTTDKLVTVPQGTTLEKAKSILQKHRIEKVLVTDDGGKLSGLITVKDILKKENCPNASTDIHGRLICGAAVGVSDDVLDRVAALVDAQVDLVVVDTAHGHSKGVLNVVSDIKKKFSSLDVVAGNVATGDGTRALIDAGVDAVKVGIGAGSSCTTRIVAGVGVPQLSAVFDSYEVASKSGIPIISDGGMRYSGDIAKSLAAGANLVMLGTILAGTDESPGEIILWEGRSYKTFRGMGSIAAMQSGSSDRYFQDKKSSHKFVPEGIEGMVPYKGTVKDTIHQLLGGIRASLGYCGSKDIKELKEKAEFIQITGSGMKESHPHDINITKEAPNYQQPH